MVDGGSCSAAMVWGTLRLVQDKFRAKKMLRVPADRTSRWCCVISALLLLLLLLLLMLLLLFVSQPKASRNFDVSLTLPRRRFSKELWRHRRTSLQRQQKCVVALSLCACNLFFHSGRTVAHVGQTDQIDHDLDHLYLNLPFWDALRDLYSTDPTQEACPRSSRFLYGSHPATWAMYVDHADEEHICRKGRI